MNQSPVQIAIVGGGAVGCYFGGMLARAGMSVRLLARARTVEAIAAKGLRIIRAGIDDPVALTASTDPSIVRGADVVLLSVKSFDSASAAREIAPFLDAECLLVSMQNGVENPSIIAPLVPCAVLPAVVYVAAEMTAAHEVTHSGRGDLVIGEAALAGHRSRVSARAFAQLAERAGVACRVSDNIDGEAWEKLAMNCALNAISALTRARYGTIHDFAPTHAVLDQAVLEVDAVARAAGVHIPVDDLRAAASRLSVAMSRATSSTAQDIARSKRTEIDALNGYIARRGAELGVPTPVNSTLHALVRLLEQGVLAA